MVRSKKMIAIKYEARKGSLYKDTDAQIIGTELEKLAKGGDIFPIPPEAVVEAAKASGSPLHPYFEWNDGEAAHRWRVHQARTMIGAIMVVLEEKPSVGPVRAFYNIIDEDENGRNQGYIPLARVLSMREYRDQIIAKALKEAEAWQERYKIYSELTPIFKAIERMVEEKCEVEV
jgi:hypothetical protein